MAKKRKRPSLATEESETPEVPMMDDGIPPSLLHISLDKWAHSKRFGGDRLKTWKHLSGKIENGDIIPFYAEYMELGKPTSPGFAMDGVCFVYEPETEGEREGRGPKQTRKAPENNIYIYW